MGDHRAVGYFSNQSIKLNSQEKKNLFYPGSQTIQCKIELPPHQSRTHLMREVLHGNGERLNRVLGLLAPILLVAVERVFFLFILDNQLEIRLYLLFPGVDEEFLTVELDRWRCYSRRRRAALVHVIVVVQVVMMMVDVEDSRRPVAVLFVVGR